MMSDITFAICSMGLYVDRSTESASIEALAAGVRDLPPGRHRRMKKRLARKIDKAHKAYLASKQEVESRYVAAFVAACKNEELPPSREDFLVHVPPPPCPYHRVRAAECYFLKRKNRALRREWVRLSETEREEKRRECRVRLLMNSALMGHGTTLAYAALEDSR